MAKSKPSNKKTSTETAASKVTRIKAVDTTPVSTKKQSKESSTPVKQADDITAKQRSNPFKALATYFKGSWHELRQVRWPTRKATWELTGAVLAFTAFFVVLIVALDAVFKYLFDLMLG